jgi:hypothetical protein
MMCLLHEVEWGTGIGSHTRKREPQIGADYTGFSAIDNFV